MQNKKIFIIEHLEAELWPWCIIEYKHISKIVGKENLWFTNVKKDGYKLVEFGQIFKKSVKDIKLKNACILDPESDVQLTPENSKPFEFIIFGGILGDNPPKKRTEIELSRFVKNAKTFNLGKEQMSTDNAVYVVKQIIEGRNLIDLKFQDEIEIDINDIESTILPYRYAIVDGKPLISPELIDFLKKQE